MAAAKWPTNMQLELHWNFVQPEGIQEKQRRSCSVFRQQSTMGALEATGGGLGDGPALVKAGLTGAAGTGSENAAPEEAAGKGGLGKLATGMGLVGATITTGKTIGGGGLGPVCKNTFQAGCVQDHLLTD